MDYLITSPNKSLATLWFYIQPILFGTVGATLVFDKLSSDIVG